MQTVIIETYENPFNTKGIEKYQDIIHCREEIPTVEEFINSISEKVKMEDGNLKLKNNDYTLEESSGLKTNFAFALSQESV